MGDKGTYDSYNDAPHTTVSRRRFLQGAGIAAAGVAALGIGHNLPTVWGQKAEVPPDDQTAKLDCHVA